MSATISEISRTQRQPDAVRLLAVSARSEGEPFRPYPSLFQINTRVLLTSLSRETGRPATLDDVPDKLIDGLAEDGFDVVWFLGVWQTGCAGQKISSDNPEWRHEFQELLPDFSERDVCGSCFAIRSYSVSSDFGGNAALARLRGRMQNRGLRLLLDFVPNHMAPDHPWVREHPEYFVHGTDALLDREPQNYTRIATPQGQVVMAYGRDPYFPGWPDTLQLNYANPDLQEAMASELENIAGMCDGVRCDMAMLILPNVFERTWGLRPASFWPDAISRTRARRPGFLFMAEVYWDMEWTLQQEGFDYTYDKRLYDRLRDGHARPVRDHFRADMEFQRRSARFLENHDEPRAAATFSREVHEAAAVLTFLCPGLRFIHDGQMDGLTIRIPVHLNRGPVEAGNRNVREFYDRLLGCLRRPDTHAEWRLLECRPAWTGNWTWDCYIVFAWLVADQTSLVIAVNYAPNHSQCYVQVPAARNQGRTTRFQDLMSSQVYDRDSEDLRTRGLYLDLPPWGYYVFDIT